MISLLIAFIYIYAADRVTDTLAVIGPCPFTLWLVGGAFEGLLYVWWRLWGACQTAGEKAFGAKGYMCQRNPFSF